MDHIRGGGISLAYTLPDLPYDYSALEPHISGQIIELHHGPDYQRRMSVA